MNNNNLYKAINTYQTKVTNLILEDIDLAIKEIKKQNMNPVDAYKYLKRILDDDYEELTFSFASDNEIPLSEEALTKIDEHINPYYLEAAKYAKSKVNELVDKLENDDVIDLYDELKKR